jgi:general secretion pathway protein G
MRNKRGFTLIELLIVFALIALLLTLALPRFLGSTETAKEKVRAQNLSTLRDAIDKFRADQGRYPKELPELVQRGYLRAMPLDPVSGTDGWAPVASPAGEAGVYDVAAPAAAATASAAQ